MRCNCENSGCAVCGGKGCTIETDGTFRAMYIGAICSDCAKNMPAEYLIDPYSTRGRQVYLEHEVLWRGDYVMLEATRVYDLEGPWDDEGHRQWMCNPIYLFRVLRYNKLTECYEEPIADQLSEYDNIEFQKLLYELDSDQAAAAAEDRHDR